MTGVQTCALPILVDLLMSIEDEFEVEIPDEEVENIKTVGALVEYIESHSNV